MTRINCIPVEDLADQHLLAEYREITRVSKLAKPLESYGKYTLGKGHVRFFYNKGGFLKNRTEELYLECSKRGFSVKEKLYEDHPEGLNALWLPSEEDVSKNLERLRDKLEIKPDLYRFWKDKIVDKNFY